MRIFDFCHTSLSCAVSATVEGVVGFYAVPYYLAAAVVAYGREHVNRALEAVERVASACRNHLEGQIIFVATYLTLCHLHSLFYLRTVKMSSDAQATSKATGTPPRKSQHEHVQAIGIFH
jgi:hypothetical protein